MPVTQCAAHVPSGTALCFESVKNPRFLAGPVPTRDMRRGRGIAGPVPTGDIAGSCGPVPTHDILRACPHARHAESQALSPRVINKVLFEENGIGIPTDCIKLS